MLLSEVRVDCSIPVLLQCELCSALPTPADLLADEEVTADRQDNETVLLVPRANDVTEVLHMLEQELAAYEEQELAIIGTGRGGRGRGDRGRAGVARSARLEMEDLVDLAHETALARYGFAQKV